MNALAFMESGYLSTCVSPASFWVTCVPPRLLVREWPWIMSAWGAWLTFLCQAADLSVGVRSWRFWTEESYPPSRSPFNACHHPHSSHDLLLTHACRHGDSWDMLLTETERPPYWQSRWSSSLEQQGLYLTYLHYLTLYRLNKRIFSKTCIKIWPLKQDVYTWGTIIAPFYLIWKCRRGSYHHKMSFTDVWLT